MIGKYIVVIGATLVCAPSVVASPADIPGCHWKTINTAAVVKLSGREVVKFLNPPIELGRFDIENHGVTAITLHGIRHGSDFYIQQPYVNVEALTTDMSWQVEGAIPGSYDIPPDKIEVQPNSKASFVAYIHFTKLLNSTGLLRLTMQDGESKSCFLSDPFQENETKSSPADTRRKSSQHRSGGLTGAQ